NVEREARGFAAINGFWPWGAATLADVAAPTAVLAGAELPPWLAAIATRHGASFGQLLAEQGPDLIYCDGSLAEAALGADWAGWLAQVQRLDQDVFTPLLHALTSGGIGKARLVLSHRGALAEFTTTNIAQRKFWRRPTLDRLLP
ncbi:MAG: hypothetical protein JWR56_2033, partial [Massilia sp.]|nr:hypothetical protein [Massilia sp.]